MSQITTSDRLALARRSLQGLALGDSFGQTFFGAEAERRVEHRLLRPEAWYFTDDTIMAIGVYRTLEEHGQIDQDALGAVFGACYRQDPNRGYGATVQSVLRALDDGADWRQVSPEVFGGMGSMGNGAAMRVAPVGAYFYDDLEEAARQATLSAQVTHFNDEGVASAVAVATAAALMVGRANGTYLRQGDDFVRDVADNVPESDTKSRILSGLQVRADSRIDFAVSVLGNGRSMLGQDTVPLAVWCVAHLMDSYEEALWRTVSALGDRDTTCAIAGGIVALNDDAFPEAWTRAAEDPFGSKFYLGTAS